MGTASNMALCGIVLHTWYDLQRAFVARLKGGWWLLLLLCCYVAAAAVQC